jgi:hypothetical protein
MTLKYINNRGGISSRLVKVSGMTVGEELIFTCTGKSTMTVYGEVVK